MAIYFHAHLKIFTLKGSVPLMRMGAVISAPRTEDALTIKEQDRVVSEGYICVLVRNDGMNTMLPQYDR